MPDKLFNINEMQGRLEIHKMGFNGKRFICMVSGKNRLNASYSRYTIANIIKFSDFEIFQSYLDKIGLRDPLTKEIIADNQEVLDAYIEYALDYLLYKNGIRLNMNSNQVVKSCNQENAQRLGISSATQRTVKFKSLWQKLKGLPWRFSFFR